MNELSITENVREPYIEEIENSFFKNDEMKTFSIRAQARRINNLVDVVLHFTDAKLPRAEIKDIRIGTLKKIQIKDERQKNVSWMRIVIQKK